jgi:pyruvate kinase
LNRLNALGAEVRTGERARLAGWRSRLLGSDYAGDAANLAAYLAFRQHDIREIQDQLGVLGLSSLGRTEAHVRAGIAAVSAALGGVLGDDASLASAIRIGRLCADQDRILDARAASLLGPRPAGRRTRVMVTLPSDAADDPGLIADLIARGMDLARINGAHDGPDIWRAMAARVRTAARDAGRDCRILVDLPGPKLRIGPLPSAPGWLRLKSPDSPGITSSFLLDGSGAPGVPKARESQLPSVAVDRVWLARVKAGDRIKCIDARGRARTLTAEVCESPALVRVSTPKSIWLVEGTRLRRVGGRAKTRTTEVLPFEAKPGRITVRAGLTIRLVAEPPAAESTDDPSAADEPWIVCPEPGVLKALSAGHEVDIDDGHIVTRVESVDANGARLLIVSTRRPEERLREDQGLNFPDSPIRGEGFLAEDLAALDVAAEIADVVGLSFAQSPEDVDRLIAELDARGAQATGVIAKIETQAGIERLPDIIVAGASRRPFGVMIARGDLAIEIGYERLAEMQEELLWLCEAAHVPVVWATQVLESLVKTGIPTRAELTDAAMAQRAECVMLNKGPHILEGVETLVDVIVRMEAHQDKKTPRLRALHSW